jgi:uncharacterized coiled-coil DUF342 family protein
MAEKLKRLDSIDEACNYMSNQYDKILKKLNEQHELIKKLSTKIDHLNNELANRDKTIQDLTDQICELEQSHLSHNLEICNIPVKNSESVLETVKKVAKVCNVSMYGIQEIYREKPRRKNQIPAIIVRFSTVGRRKT